MSSSGGLHNSLVPMFWAKTNHNGHGVVNVGYYGRWLYFRESQLLNYQHPVGKALQLPTRALFIGAPYLWSVIALVGAYHLLARSQRTVFEKKLDYGKAYFCKESESKTRFGKYWDTEGVRKQE
eukprot:NODE_10917_length_571_cov_93.122768_g10639_i0.p1 GENE.NODE_10917_length_571_cov_93.122768_g10639_i0~~NODE_10917_length_571_cov_93.122768_g10639_i0.p1  ORF type:complete len:124 (+),score=24.05 NODE_10917_length_571_cov_93.122768_g10639_i0:67-438(+)